MCHSVPCFQVMLPALPNTARHHMYLHETNSKTTTTRGRGSGREPRGLPPFGFKHDGRRIEPIHRSPPLKEKMEKEGEVCRYTPSLHGLLGDRHTPSTLTCRATDRLYATTICSSRCLPPKRRRLTSHLFTNRNMLTVTLLKDEAAMLTTLPDAPGYSSAGEKAALEDTCKRQFDRLVKLPGI